MKNFVDTFKLFFVLSGAVMGAGFLSGGELLEFFGSKRLVFLIISGALFFIGFAFIGEKRDGLTKTAFLIADGVFSCAMLAGLDAISWQTGAIKGLPAVSVFSLAVFHFFLSGNIGKLEKANCVLIPLSVITVFIAVVYAKPVSVPRQNAGVKDAVNAVLYACMNLFVALPSASIAAKGKKGKAKFFSALIFAVFFVVFAFLILRASPNTVFPLTDISRGTHLYPFIVGAIFIGSFTSLICYLYPLKSLIYEKTADKKRRGVYCFLLYCVLFAISRAGITAIIKYCYPLVGALGLFSVVKSFFGIKRRAKGDTTKKRSSQCRERKKLKSKNLPKKNTATI